MTGTAQPDKPEKPVKPPVENSQPPKEPEKE